MEQEDKFDDNDTKLFDILNDSCLQWNRSTEDEVYVWVSGYKMPDCYTVEKAAMSCRYVCIDMQYDSHSMKTLVTLKKRKTKESL
ncbi:MAG TPA: hypothetical protein VI911_12105 [Patescibacteria group bacterium]|nr:hypothetical protein [Patescibacteria group bacterium]